MFLYLFLWSMNISFKFNFLALSADLNWLEVSGHLLISIFPVARVILGKKPTARSLHVAESENSSVEGFFFSYLITLLTTKPC